MEENEGPKPPRKRASGNKSADAGPAKPRARRVPGAHAAASRAAKPADPAASDSPQAAVSRTRAPAPRRSRKSADAPLPSAEKATPPARSRAPRTPPLAPPTQAPRSAAAGPRPPGAGHAEPRPHRVAPKAAPAAAGAAPPQVDPSSRESPSVVPSFARTPPPPPPRAPSSAHPADASTRSLRVIDALLARLPPRHRARVREYLVLMRMDRPVGALLLLWPTWWALWFASADFPPIGALVVFTLGVFVMRSAGCVINDYADHAWLDAHVERTRARPMAAGRVSKREALLLFAGLLAFAFVLVLFTNALTIKLSFVGAGLAALYPFAKRVTHLAQVVLGAAFGWSIPMAFAAVTGELPPLCWLLFLANVLFSVIYDTEYAMVDRDDDLRVGAKSTAILFGDADRAIIGVLMATFLVAMLLAGTRAELGWPWFAGVAAAAGLFGWQQWRMRTREREACFAAFRNNNWVGFALWVGLLLALALR
jgi:4-hydroxybenzoate polyprenyltransferase